MTMRFQAEDIEGVITFGAWDAGDYSTELGSEGPWVYIEFRANEDFVFRDAPGDNMRSLTLSILANRAEKLAKSIMEVLDGDPKVHYRDKK